MLAIRPTLVERTRRMIHPGRISLLIVLAMVAVTSSAAAASTHVVPARGATRAALRHAFVVQDGSAVGITGEYVTSARPKRGVVCQRTPDGRLARFLFGSAGGSWRFLLTTTTSSTGNSVDRALERACH
jgi:hypothetical protein